MEYNWLKVKEEKALIINNYKKESPISFVIYVVFELIIASENNYTSKWCPNNCKKHSPCGKRYMFWGKKFVYCFEYKCSKPVEVYKNKTLNSSKIQQKDKGNVTKSRTNIIIRS